MDENGEILLLHTSKNNVHPLVITCLDDFDFKSRPRTEIIKHRFKVNNNNNIYCTSPTSARFLAGDSNQKIPVYLLRKGKYRCTADLLFDETGKSISNSSYGKQLNPKQVKQEVSQNSDTLSYEASEYYL